MLPPLAIMDSVLHLERICISRFPSISISRLHLAARTHAETEERWILHVGCSYFLVVYRRCIRSYVWPEAMLSLSISGRIRQAARKFSSFSPRAVTEQLFQECVQKGIGLDWIGS
ncbi:hypothetical protein BU26DRAFT_12415 [Trematosphaeria pertusa]|uniref:Uncharacterized protein n=1 Tax=Trematosphaeria pertusa TaxID=390896 RepID=A0A6A6IZT6_9PLEO|nr:uncharacterized protein BU26DRAFT_12415 [Trematosphaeria pertusa]KAF2255959.1 hypothetical protein BU26DRAFT_12415 [Trematosphaeria pertusa]